MESQIPIHVKISADRRKTAVGVELDYGREAFIRVVWSPAEAMAVARALAEAADELLQTAESAADRARIGT